MTAIQAGKRLHGLDIRQAFVNVHGMEQRLIKSRLEFVCDHKNTVGILLKRLLNYSTGESVDICLGNLAVFPIRSSGKGNDGLERTMTLLQQTADCLIILNSPADGAGYNHCSRFSADLTLCNYFTMEVLHHNGGFLMDRIAIGFHIIPENCLGTLFIEFWVILNSFRQLIIALYRGVILQNIQNEAFLDGLLHGVNIVRRRLVGPIRLRNFFPEHLQSFILWRCREGKIARILYHLTAFDDRIDLIFKVVFVIINTARKNHVHFCGQASVLAGMRLIN